MYVRAGIFRIFKATKKEESCNALLFKAVVSSFYYMTSTLDLVLNAFINVWCVGFGAAIAVLISRKPVA